MARFSAKVTVDYYFDIPDEIDNEEDANKYAWYNFQDYGYTAEIYDVEIEDEGPDEDDEEGD